MKRHPILIMILLSIFLAASDNSIIIYSVLPVENSIIPPFTPINVSENMTYFIYVSEVSYSIPRMNYYLGVGGYNYKTLYIEFTDQEGRLLKNVTTWGGIIFLGELDPGIYIINSYGIGKVVLALDLQSPRDIFEGELHEPITFLITPFEAEGIHIVINTNDTVSRYRIEIYNQSVDKIFSEEYVGSVEFDFYFPDQSEWNDIIYIRIVPLDPVAIKFRWYPLNADVTIGNSLLYLFGLMLFVLVFIILLSMVKGR